MAGAATAVFATDDEGGLPCAYFRNRNNKTFYIRVIFSGRRTATDTEEVELAHRRQRPVPRLREAVVAAGSRAVRSRHERAQEGLLRHFKNGENVHFRFIEVRDSLTRKIGRNMFCLRMFYKRGRYTGRVYHRSFLLLSANRSPRTMQSFAAGAKVFRLYLRSTALVWICFLMVGVGLYCPRSAIHSVTASHSQSKVSSPNPHVVLILFNLT